jgi:hypothetical protein
MAAVARGEKPLSNSSGSRHHFVPEFLLRKFRGRGAEGRHLFVLDKSNGAIEESTPKEAGWQERLYDIDSIDGKHDGLIEGLFGLAENFASGSLKTLLSTNADQDLADDDRGNLAFLIAAQEQRVPGALDELRLNMAIAGSSFAAVDLANLDGSASMRRMGKEAYEAFVGGRVTLQPSPDAVLEMALNATAHCARLIYQLPWTLLRARPGAGSFVCSDRPLTMFDFTPPHKFSAPGWLSSENVAAMLPLGTSACLRISPRDRRQFAVRDTTRQVDRANRFTYGFANRFVYGPTRKVLEDLYARATAEVDAFPRPIPKRLVLLEDLSTADPAVADANQAKGWDRYLAVSQDDGTERLVSYEVIDSFEDAMGAISPRNPGLSLASLESIAPPDLRRS